MSWLLELLVDAIREMCSQFIVDMMELITNMFTELLSCNLSLFEELFSVVGSLYKNVIVPTGIAILLMILVWQLFKSMFGGKAGVNAEEPIELICRSAISLFLLAGSKPLVDYILRIAGTPYQWVIGTKVKVASFSGYVSTLEGVTDTLGISSLSISVLMLIMQFVVAWNYFKMLMVIAERYVLLGVFSYTAPLAFATGGSKATNNILASWSKMFGGQVVLVILNAWCMKMFLSGYGNMMASSYGFTKFFAATLCLVGFCKITFKLDSYMASLGVNLGRPAPGMGAAGAMLAASRIISQVARTASGSGATGDVGGTRTDMGSADGMTTNFTGPIPMTPNGGNAMDINDMTSDGDFDTLALLLNAQITGGSGYQYKFVTNKTTFDIVIKLLEYLQKGVDAVKNALSTIFHWTDFVTGGSSGDSFVAGNIDASGDIITYDTVGKGVKKVVYFNQTEEPWKGMSYGSSTIGASGCGPTSMAIIISTLTGQTVTPQMTCAYSIANGEYVPGMGTSHSFPTNAAYHWGLTCERVGKDRMNYVVQSLKEGKMVVEICEAYTITGSGSGHFIVLTGVTRDGYITIADCASRERTGKVYSVETIKSYGRDLSEGAFWIVGKK